MNDHLDRVLFEWEYADFYDVRCAIEGCLILGGIGSGKTSGSGALLAGHYLSNGFGMLILTAKQNEKDLWVKYCKKYGRTKDLVIFSPDSGEQFNFFDYELSRQDDGKGITHNIADVLKTVIKAGHQNSQESDKAFWDSSLQQLLVNSVDLCLLTNNKKFEHIYQIVQSAPRNKQQLHDPNWQKSSKCFQLIHHVGLHLDKQPKTPQVEKLSMRLERIEDFFLESWIYLSEKTRSIIEQMFFGFGDRFMREPMYSLFNGSTTITPEDTMNGKIIVIDLPYLIYDKIGQDAQILWKFIWQRAMQRRKITNTSRPVALWADEFQFFISENDIFFQSTAREYRACTVYLTQNLPNFYLNAGGGEIGKTRFKALAGNLSTKFFHANSDVETNEYAADLIGKDLQWSANEGQTMGEKFTYSSGQSETLVHLVEPSGFTKLKTGGTQNNFLVEAIVHRQGKIFKSTESSHKLITLKQELL